MSLSPQAVDRFRSRFGGAVLTSASSDYDAALVLFNTMIDRRPAVIAQCASNADVKAAIRFARDNDLEIAVRGGGHSVAGNALVDAGLVIDLRPMNAARVDADARIVTIGGGATMGTLDRATEPFGLATTGGRVSTTGVGGFALGGGGGWVDRKFGLACDNLVSAEVVTAEGEILTASEDEHADLFWGLHGGGGNFGVVTSMRLRLHPLDDVFGGLLLWPAEAGPRVLRAYRDFMASAPDEVGGGTVFLTGPEADFVPPQLLGRPAFAVYVFYAGPEAVGRQVFSPILSLGHEGGFARGMRYADFQCVLDDPPGYRNYWSAEYLGGLPHEAVDAYCAGALEMIVPSPSGHVLFVGGGQAARETADWPLAWRRAPWCFHPFGLWPAAEDDARGMAWVRSSRERLKPWATGDVYLNFTGDEGNDRTVAGFGGNESYARLARIKATYDPQNIFHINHNIRPAN